MRRSRRDRSAVILVFTVWCGKRRQRVSVPIGLDNLIWDDALAGTPVTASDVEIRA